LPSADVVLEWNAIALDALKNDSLLGAAARQNAPTRASRALAIVQAAVFDAVNSIDRSYQPYLFQVPAPPGASITAAAAQAPEQTQIGYFWGYDGSPGLGTPPRLFNQVAEVIAVGQHNTVIQNARFFALVNLALADAGITTWDGKYDYSFWRPVTAIRENDPGTGPTGLGSGNPFLVGQGDPKWSPLGAPADNGGGTNFTPPFPAYASGHATFGGPCSA
jgi:hypothetical protein